MCSEIQKSLGFEPGVWIRMSVILLEATRTACFFVEYGQQYQYGSHVNFWAVDTISAA